MMATPHPFLPGKGRGAATNAAIQHIVRSAADACFIAMYRGRGSKSLEILIWKPVGRATHNSAKMGNEIFFWKGEGGSRDVLRKSLARS